MASKFNLLIPRFSAATWDGFIPLEASFSRDYIYLSFNPESTRASIQSFRIWIDTFCCSTDSSGTCGSTNTLNEGYFSMFILTQHQRNKSNKWVTSSTSACTYDWQGNYFLCVDRQQTSPCGGNYDSAIDDVDFYNVLSGFETTALSKTGSMVDTLIHDIVVNDVNPCSVNIGSVLPGKNIFTSLL